MLPRPWLAAVCLFAGVLAPHLAGQSLITNGGFENGSFAGWTTNFTAPNNAALIITPATFTPSRVGSGAYAAEFDVYEVTATAILSQTFTSAASAAYEVSFDFGSIAQAGSTPRLQFDVLGADGSTVLATQTFFRAGDGAGMHWSAESFSFIADGSAATLRITDLTSGFAADPVLDNIAVTAVPEPAHLALWAGVAGLGALLVRRRRR